MITEKIGRFVNSYKHVGNVEIHRLVDSNLPYMDMLESNKWASKGKEDIPTEEITKMGHKICINGDATCKASH